MKRIEIFLKTISEEEIELQGENKSNQELNRRMNK